MRLTVLTLSAALIVAAAALARGASHPLPAPVQAAPLQSAAETSFAKEVARLSEPGGYFDSDNLISNETSYLHVLGPMRSLGVSGGAYLGVGPDQNFAYMAQVRPHVAYMIDIRRDNLIQHLFYKAVFAAAPTRVEFMALWLGRVAPKDARTNAAEWKEKSIQQLVDYIDGARVDSAHLAATRASLLARVRGYGVPLDSTDIATMMRMHDAFVSEGLGLRYTSIGRGPRPYYPTLRQLLLEKDLTGRLGSWLAREEDYDFLRTLEGRDLVIPVVGDLSGTHAMQAIAKDIAARREHVSVFYTSNVEFYLFRGGAFDRFAANVAALPRDPRSVIVRSFFGGGFGIALPQSQPGYYSTQLMETIDDFTRRYSSGEFKSYMDLVRTN